MRSTRQLMMAGAICTSLLFSGLAFGQQWEGSAGLSGNLYRTGRIAIGHNNPKDQLDIQGNVRASGNFFGGRDGLMRIANNTSAFNSRSWIEFWGAHATRQGELTLAGTYIDFRLNSNLNSAGNVRMRITSDGNVGIGTLTPGSFKLAVEGKIGAREIVVQTGAWADFVFSSDYRLPSLAEVEAHINENGHLPGIPSEEEVLEKGIAIGEMQTKLLQKIEELTLYMIELQKENDALKERVEALESEGR